MKRVLRLFRAYRELELRHPIVRYDNGSSVDLDSVSGGGDPRGEWAELGLIFYDANGKEECRRRYVDAKEYECAQQKVKDLARRNSNLLKENARLEAKNAFMRERVQVSEKRADAVAAELVDVLKTAGDSMGLRLTGRRMFSKAPVEAPPATNESRQPINLSAGSQRVFAGDVARQKTKAFFENLGKQAGVVPDDQKPN